MQVLHDKGGGITEESKKHFSYALEGLKKNGFIPIQVTIHSSGEFTFELYGIVQDDSAIVLESGFNSGYSGEGPHGSVWALEQLGVPSAIANEVFRRRSLVISFRGGAAKNTPE